MEDSQIIKAIQKGGIEEEKALKALYRQYLKMIASMVYANHGSESDAHDIFQEAVIVFYEKVKNNSFEKRAAISTFLFRVAKNIWIDELKKRGRQINFQKNASEPAPTDIPLDRLLNKERYTFVSEMVEQLGQDCQQVLRLAIYEDLPMNEISQKMGFKNEQIARNKKSKCLNYLRKIIRETPYFSAIIKELS